MRLDAEWMIRADDRILEFLEEEGPHPPSKRETDERIKFGTEYLGRRWRDYLRPHSLVKNLGNGVYAITEDGTSYVDGELDVSQIESRG